MCFCRFQYRIDAQKPPKKGQPKKQGPGLKLKWIDDPPGAPADDMEPPTPPPARPRHPLPNRAKEPGHPRGRKRANTQKGPKKFYG